MEYPVYWTYSEWTEGFRRLLDYLKLDEVGVAVPVGQDSKIVIMGVIIDLFKG